MRIAVFANPTISNIMGASDYVEFREACEFIVEKYPEAFFYFCLPKRAQGKVTDVIDRVHFCYYDDNGFMFYDGQAEAQSGFVEMFHSRIGKYPIDAVWTTRTTMAASIGRRLQDHRLPDGAIPVIIEEYKPVDFSENAQTTTETDIVVNTLAYLLGWNMFDTHHDYDLALKAAGRYLTGASIGKIKERSTVIYCGINFEFIEKYIDDIKKNQKFTVLFGGRINALKRTDMVFDCIDNFYKFGRDVRGVICTPSVAKTTAQELIDRYPSFEFNWSVGKQEFLRRAAGCHAFVNASTNEGFSVGIVEQLYIGLVGIMPNRPWVKGLLMEHYDKYPFIFNDRAEMLAKLKWVYENYEEAKESLAPIQKMIGERYSRRIASEKTYDFMIECIEKQSGMNVKRIGRDTKKLMEKTLLLMPPIFSLPQFCKNMADRSDVMKPADFDRPIRGRPSKWMVYKYLQVLGCKDMVDGAVPWFKKS